MFEISHNYLFKCSVVARKLKSTITIVFSCLNLPLVDYLQAEVK